MTNYLISIVKSILNQYNTKYELIPLYDGLEILKKLRKDREDGNRIKCIITNEDMDFINGSEAIRVIRNLEKKKKIKNIKIISIVRNNDKENIDNIINCGSDIFLKKPGSLHEICSSLINLNLI